MSRVFLATVDRLPAMSSLSRASGRVLSLMRPRCHLCTSLLQYSSSSQDGKTDENKIHLVDTLALIKRLEAQKLVQFEVVQGSILSKFISEMEDMQEKNLISMQREIDEVNEIIDKMERNLKSEFEKMEIGFASKLEIMENDFASIFDKEIPAMKEQLQNMKFEITKYLLGIFASIGTVCLGILYVGANREN